MTDLIAIGYGDEETASPAAEEVFRLSSDLVIEPDAVAVIVRDHRRSVVLATVTSSRLAIIEALGLGSSLQAGLLTVSIGPAFRLRTPGGLRQVVAGARGAARDRRSGPPVSCLGSLGELFRG